MGAKCCGPVRGSAEDIDGIQPIRSAEDLDWFAAARKGDAILLKRLMAMQADVNAITGEEDPECCGATALVLASRAGHINSVRTLLSSSKLDTEVKTRNLENKSRNDQTALFWAASEGHAGVISALLEDLRVNADPVSSSEFSALMIACQEGHREAVRALCSGKANPNYHKPMFGGRKCSPIVVSVCEDKPDIVSILVQDFGVSPNSLGYSMDDPENDLTVLHMGVEGNKIDACIRLLELRANADRMDSRHRSPFDMAFGSNSVEIVMTMLLVGCDTSRAFSMVEHLQRTGDARGLLQLLKGKPDLCIDTIPSLHKAVLLGDVDRLAEELTRFEDVNDAQQVVDQAKMPAVYYAIELGNKPLARQLLVDVHGLPSNLVDKVTRAIPGSEQRADELGGQTFAALCVLFQDEESEAESAAEGAAALLLPWMGSVAALNFLKEKSAEFNKFREICRKRGKSVRDRIDTKVTTPVLEMLSRIGEEEFKGNVRQDAPGLLPRLHYYANEDVKQTMSGNHEVYYAMSLALLALALNGVFVEDMQTLFEPIASKIHDAEPKSFGRMYNKLLNKLDHGSPMIGHPRPAENVDVLRIAVEVEKWEDVDVVFKALKARYKVLRVKNSHEVGADDVGGYRNVLANFAYESGRTFGEVFGQGRFHWPDGMVDGWKAPDPESKAWLTYASTLPNAQDWKMGLCALWLQGRTDPQARIAMSAEVQIIYSPYMIGRILAHLLFKISRCESGASEMSRDFAHGFEKEERLRMEAFAKVKSIAGKCRLRAMRSSLSLA